MQQNCFRKLKLILDMPGDNINIKSDINQLRDYVASVKKDIFLAKEKLKKITQKEQNLKRYFDDDNRNHIDLQDELTRENKKITSKIKEYSKTLLANEKLLEAEWTRAVEITDPSIQLGKFDSKQPILLLPLRIETRFKKVKDKKGLLTDQLWVRVFPDDCSIDTFEEYLSESEIKNAQDFWTDWLIAAGDESNRRGSWRTLVDSHGAGRAQYIIDKYKPENYDEILNFGNGSIEPEILLAIKAENGTLNDDDKVVLSEYWLQIWHANGDIIGIKDANIYLVEKVGEEKADYLITNYCPKNIEYNFPETEDRDTAKIEVKFVIFPHEDDFESQQQTWSHAPGVKVMPERLYVLGYRGTELKLEMTGEPIPFPLICGPDPQIENESDFEEYLDGDLKITKGMKWMVDFEEARAKGMGFIIDDKADKDNHVLSGYDRLIIVGVRFNADKEEGKKIIEELIHNHYYGNSGFSFVQVGTPTNNIEGSESGYTESETADESYNLIFRAKEDSVDEEFKTWWSAPDRYWFSKLIGIDTQTFDNTINTDGYDLREARAMNIALWPATWGYFFESMMQPVFNEKQIENIRWFFNHFVLGRGSLPSIRIDNQPYGILPTTVFSRLEWFGKYNIQNSDDHYYSKEYHVFLNRLNNIFKKIQPHWNEMSKDVSYVGKKGDPHQIMLDVLGLHGGSVEFYKRYGESLNHLWNLLKSQESQQTGVWGRIRKVLGKAKNKDQIAGSTSKANNSTPMMEQYLKALMNSNKGKTVLKELGYTGEISPELFEKLYVLTPEEILGPLIDDKPLSEINKIRPYTTDGNNYIQWLIDVAATSFEKLRKEEGFTDNPPEALLYLMLRHALELGYWDAGINLFNQNDIIKPELLSLLRMEPDFIHIRDLKNSSTKGTKANISVKTVDSPFTSESRYSHLYRKLPPSINNKEMSVAEYLTEILKTDNDSTRYLWDQLKALEHLKDTPTARLERSFTEHIDCATYRFDAWKWGLVNYHLHSLRNRTVSEANDSKETTAGLYVGAYGWLENVKTENKILTPAKISDELNSIFNPSEDNPIVKDNKNAGHIQAPSLNHAVTASLLRNAYLSMATQEDPGIYGINLSSERVRKALTVLEGIQNGQNLAALLGYQFERFVHDHNKDAYVDQYVFILRRKFPLISNLMASTQSNDPDVPIDVIEARNVLNGSDLINFVEEKIGPNGEPDYFNYLGLTDIQTSEKQIIIDAIDYIRDINDAVADLGMAESIHHVVQGNIDRAAGTLDTYSKGNYPQMPDVIQTPRTGVNITHRVGVQIDPDAIYDGVNSPRAMIEPGLNSLLTDILPGLESIICNVSFYHNETKTEIKDFKIAMSDLDLEPIDLLYLINDESGQAMSCIDDLIIHWTRTYYPKKDNSSPPGPDAEILINYYVKNNGEGKTSVFEIAPLIKHLKAILLRSRPLRPNDIVLSTEATNQADENVFLDKERINKVVTYLKKLKSDNGQDGQLVVFIKTLEQIKNDNAGFIESIDSDLLAFVAILRSLNLTGMPHTGLGFAHDWRKTQLKNLLQKFRDLVKRWDEKDAEYETLVNSIDDIVSSDEKIIVLRRAERLISSDPTVDPVTDTADYEVIIERKKEDFDNKKSEFMIFLVANHLTLSGALSESEELLKYSDFDLVPTGIEDIKEACKIFTLDMLTKASLLLTELDKRVKKIENELMPLYDTEISPSKQVQLLQEMAKCLLTEDTIMVPAFDLPLNKKEEWVKAHGKADQLLAYQKEKLKNPLPVDDWLYGVARVREKMDHIEQVILWAEAFKDQVFDLTPVQLPYLEPYCWLALEFGVTDGQDEEEFKKVLHENDHLLYTAYYQKSIDITGAQCGLLIDEWTEVIPIEKGTTGIAFHYDRPDSEAPQSMLLAVSPQLQENWKWNDLVDAINETLDEAKLRAVEPEQIDKTGFANFLPATISSVSAYPISIMMNYAFNNLSIPKFQVENHE
jgi:hypothetical protein